MHRPALDVRLEQAAAVVAGAVVPGAHGTGIGRTERARDLPEALDRGLHLVGDRGGVLHVDVGPDGGVGPGHTRGVAKARADARKRLVLAVHRARGLSDQHVRHDVRKVADCREQAVVGVGVERKRARAERQEQAVEALVEDAARARARGQVPGGAQEEVGAGVLDAGRLGPCYRMAADEPLVGDVGDDRTLRGAHIGDDRLGGGRAQRLIDHGRQGADGSTGEHRSGALDGLFHRAGGAVDGAALERCAQDLVVRIEAGDIGAAGPRGEADRPADQPDAEDR